MKVDNILRVERAGRGVRIAVTAYDQRTCRPMTTINTDFTKDGARAIVEDLCKMAGLPNPW